MRSPAAPPHNAQGESRSIEAWVRPVLIAGLAGGLADCLGAAILYNVYLRAYSAVHPPLWGTRPIPSIASFFSLRALDLAVIWAALFALAFATQSGLRAWLRSVAGSILVTGSFATLMWLVMRDLLNRGNLEQPMLSVVGWLTYALFAAPAIVWTIRRTAPINSSNS